MSNRVFNAVLFVLLCVVVVGSVVYLGGKLQRAEVYVCYYDMFEYAKKNPWERRTVEPYCYKQNETPIKWCEYKGTQYTQGLPQPRIIAYNSSTCGNAKDNEGCIEYKEEL